MVNYIYILVIAVAIYYAWLRGIQHGYNEIKILDTILLTFLFGYGLAWLVGFIGTSNLNYLVNLHSILPEIIFFSVCTFLIIIRLQEWSLFESLDVFIPTFIIQYGAFGLGCYYDERCPDVLLPGSILLFGISFFFTQVHEAKKLTWHGQSLFIPQGVSGLVQLSFLGLMLLAQKQNFSSYGIILMCFVGAIQLFLKHRQVEIVLETLPLPLRGSIKKNRLRRFTMQTTMKSVMQLPQDFIESIKNKLIHQEKQVQAEIKLIDQEDPFKSEDRADDNAELLSESTEQQSHELIDYQKKLLFNTLNAIRDALDRIAKGTYGLSVKSGQLIKKERLEVNPTAKLTIEEELQDEKEKGGKLPPMERIQ